MRTRNVIGVLVVFMAFSLTVSQTIYLCSKTTVVPISDLCVIPAHGFCYTKGTNKCQLCMQAVTNSYVENDRCSMDYGQTNPPNKRILDIIIENPLVDTSEVTLGFASTCVNTVEGSTISIVTLRGMSMYLTTTESNGDANILKLSSFPIASIDNIQWTTLPTSPSTSTMTLTGTRPSLEMIESINWDNIKSMASKVESIPTLRLTSASCGSRAVSFSVKLLYNSFPHVILYGILSTGSTISQTATPTHKFIVNGHTNYGKIYKLDTDGDTIITTYTVVYSILKVNNAIGYISNRILYRILQYTPPKHATTKGTIDDTQLEGFIIASETADFVIHLVVIDSTAGWKLGVNGIYDSATALSRLSIDIHTRIQPLTLATAITELKAYRTDRKVTGASAIGMSQQNTWLREIVLFSKQVNLAGLYMFYDIEQHRMNSPMVPSTSSVLTYADTPRQHRFLHETLRIGKYVKYWAFNQLTKDKILHKMYSDIATDEISSVNVLWTMDSLLTAVGSGYNTFEVQLEKRAEYSNQLGTYDSAGNNEKINRVGGFSEDQIIMAYNLQGPFTGFWINVTSHYKELHHTIIGIRLTKWMQSTDISSIEGLEPEPEPTPEEPVTDVNMLTERDTNGIRGIKWRSKYINALLCDGDNWLSDLAKATTTDIPLETEYTKYNPQLRDVYLYTYNVKALQLSTAGDHNNDEWGPNLPVNLTLRNLDIPYSPGYSFVNVSMILTYSKNTACEPSQPSSMNATNNHTIFMTPDSDGSRYSKWVKGTLTTSTATMFQVLAVQHSHSPVDTIDSLTLGMKFNVDPAVTTNRWDRPPRPLSSGTVFSTMWLLSVQACPVACTSIQLLCDAIGNCIYPTPVTIRQVEVTAPITTYAIPSVTSTTFAVTITSLLALGTTSTGVAESTAITYGTHSTVVQLTVMYTSTSTSTSTTTSTTTSTSTVTSTVTSTSTYTAIPTITTTETSTTTVRDTNVPITATVTTTAFITTTETETTTGTGTGTYTMTTTPTTNTTTTTTDTTTSTIISNPTSSLCYQYEQCINAGSGGIPVILDEPIDELWVACIDAPYAVLNKEIANDPYFGEIGDIIPNCMIYFNTNQNGVKKRAGCSTCLPGYILNTNNDDCTASDYEIISNTISSWIEGIVKDDKPIDMLTDIDSILNGVQSMFMSIDITNKTDEEVDKLNTYWTSTVSNLTNLLFDVVFQIVDLDVLANQSNPANTSSKSTYLDMLRTVSYNNYTHAFQFPVSMQAVGVTIINKDTNISYIETVIPIHNTNTVYTNYTSPNITTINGSSNNSNSSNYSNNTNNSNTSNGSNHSNHSNSTNGTNRRRNRRLLQSSTAIDAGYTRYSFVAIRDEHSTHFVSTGASILIPRATYSSLKVDGRSVTNINVVSVDDKMSMDTKLSEYCSWFIPVQVVTTRMKAIVSIPNSKQTEAIDMYPSSDNSIVLYVFNIIWDTAISTEKEQIDSLQSSELIVWNKTNQECDLYADVSQKQLDKILSESVTVGDMGSWPRWWNDTTKPYIKVYSRFGHLMWYSPKLNKLAIEAPYAETVVIGYVNITLPDYMLFKETQINNNRGHYIISYWYMWLLGIIVLSVLIGVALSRLVNDDMAKDMKLHEEGFTFKGYMRSYILCIYRIKQIRKSRK